MATFTPQRDEAGDGVEVMGNSMKVFDDDLKAHFTADHPWVKALTPIVEAAMKMPEEQGVEMLTELMMKLIHGPNYRPPPKETK